MMGRIGSFYSCKGSHDMRQIGFCRLTVVNGTLGKLGCHNDTTSKLIT